MDTINFSDVKKLIATAHQTLCVVIHALETKILVGEINHPAEAPSPKTKRKRRTKKEMETVILKDPFTGAPLSKTGPPHIKMDLEKEYQAGRRSDPILRDTDKGIGDLPEDKDPFFAKAKKKSEKKVPVETPSSINKNGGSLNEGKDSCLKGGRDGN